MDIKLPPLGEGADSGTVVNVFVKPGDTITQGQTVLELENEKAIASIPASTGGVVSQVFVKAGDKISVGHRLLSVGSGAEPTPKPTPSSAPAKASPATVPASVPPAEVATSTVTGEEESFPKRVAAPVASPSIRRIAR